MTITVRQTAWASRGRLSTKAGQLHAWRTKTQVLTGGAAAYNRSHP